MSKYLIIGLLLTSLSVKSQVYQKTNIVIDSFYATKPTTYLPDTTQKKSFPDRQIIFYKQRLYVRDSIRNKWVEVQSASILN